MIYDFIVAGAGIVGLSTAYKLSEEYSDANILVLEKESAVAAHQTGHNSGVIHSGIYYKPGSYKAKNCVDGRHQLVQFCEENDVAYDICGKMIVASEESEIPGVYEIYERGLQNEIEGIKIIDRDEMLEIEPYVSGVKAIHVPCTGIVDFVGVCRKLADKITDGGNQVKLSSQVQSISRRNGTLNIQSSSGTYQTHFLINCAGLHSDRVARSAGVQSPIKIVPFRGEYYELTSDAEHKVKW